MFQNNQYEHKLTFSNKILNYTALAVSIFIILFVLYTYPNPGVADQGDFQRVMTVTGLGEISNRADTGEHWFKYVTTQYDYTRLSFIRLIGIVPTTSMIYPIAVSRLICRLFFMKYFDTRVLAFVYSIIYVISLYICIKSLNFKNHYTTLFLIIISVFILFDGNYLVWFNSIYGEAMMSTSLLLFISSVLYFANNIDSHSNITMFFIFISIYLFLGSKMQCFSALPFFAVFFFRIYKLNRKNNTIFHRKNNFAIPLIILLFYTVGIYMQINRTCGIDTQYNSVFYGILKNSDNPGRDLKLLGLPSDMAVEAGKHAYLSKDQYVKYTPGSYLTKNEFNKKISNMKLLLFYLKQPARLIKGMEYTASRCFDTGGSLGKYEKSSGKGYVFKLNRFTFWSDFRSLRMPKNLIFLISFYLIVIIISIIEHKRSYDIPRKIRIELLWVVVLTGLMQFPMPYIGNGEADTSKQLFLFNYTFDITFIAACTYIFSKIYSLIKSFKFQFRF